MIQKPSQELQLNHATSMSEIIQHGSKNCLRKVLNSIKVKDIFNTSDKPELSISTSVHIEDLEALLQGEDQTFIWSDSFTQNLLTVLSYQSNKKPKIIKNTNNTDFFIIYM